MNFRNVIALVTFLAFIDMSTALRCYACAGTSTSDCARGKKSSMVIQKCLDEDSENDNTDNSTKVQQVCLKLLETDFKPKLFARGCGLIPPNVTDACDYISKLLHVEGCKSCSRDLCNLRSENDV